MNTVSTLVAGVVAASALSVGACSLHATGSQGSIDVADKAFSVSDGHVTTPCFVFDLPTTGDYVVIPESEGCIADINLSHRDALTVMLVRAQVGGYDPDLLAAKTSGFEVIEPVERVLVDGVEAQRVVVENGAGLPVAMVYLPLPQGRFDYDGEPLTSVMIATHTGAPELQKAFNEVVASFHVLD